MLQRKSFMPAIRFFPRQAVRRKILVVNGHPDPRPERFCAALCAAYEEGARAGGWEVRRVEVGALACSIDCGGDALDRACEAIAWASQFTIVFPLWLGQPPPMLRSVFAEECSRAPRTPADERPGRCVVTMDMPAFAHRALLQRNNPAQDHGVHVKLPGLRQQAWDFVGSVSTIAAAQRIVWLQTLRRYGVDGR